MTVNQNAPAAPAMPLATEAGTTEPTPARRRRVWAGVLLASRAAWGVLAVGAWAAVGVI